MWKCYPHAAHQRAVEDDGADLVPAGQVHGGHGADALPVQDDVLGRDAEACPHRVPRPLNIRVQILLRRLPLGHPVAAVVVAEDVAVDAGAEAQVEAAHLAEVHRVVVGVKDGEAGVGRALDVHTRDPVAARGPCVEHFEVVFLAFLFLSFLSVLPFRLLGQHELLFVVTPILVLQHVVRSHNQCHRYIPGKAETDVMTISLTL